MMGATIRPVIAGRLAQRTHVGALRADKSPRARAKGAGTGDRDSSHRVRQRLGDVLLAAFALLLVLALLYRAENNPRARARAATPVVHPERVKAHPWPRPVA
jgi:hypothetical protein